MSVCQREHCDEDMAALREEIARLRKEADAQNRAGLTVMSDRDAQIVVLTRERDEALAFLRRATRGKEIVSTEELSAQNIANFRAAGLMYVEPVAGLGRGWVVRDRRVIEMVERDLADARHERDEARAKLAKLHDELGPEFDAALRRHDLRRAAKGE